MHSGKGKNEGCLTNCLTGSEKKKKSKRFQRVGHGLFRMRSTGIIYAVFKSVGKTRWKNLGTDDIKHARELLAEEIKRDVKIDWKRSRTVTLQELIAHYESNPMNLAGSTLKIRVMLLKVFKETWQFGLSVRVREVKPFMFRSWLVLGPRSLDHL